jgi:hypothetical protein
MEQFGGEEGNLEVGSSHSRGVTSIDVMLEFSSESLEKLSFFYQP